MNYLLIIMKRIFVLLSLIGILLISGCSNIDPKNYGNDCIVERTCGNMVGIDCHSNVDGPYYYVEKESGDIISSCGGACMSQPEYCKENCPPKEWTCDTY